ncbi:DUF3231 family protein [Brevibacillus migulae]|uniref:DUF3231 family protein n=1 Tax=Brevibacillus migulae TaxID=1644114 RepID=UPI00106DFA89|nr:DUF3231 family protein [Brevibacillus migulae]
MEHKHVVSLSSTEIAALWSTYISDTISICMSKHFLQWFKDEEAKRLVEKGLQASETHVKEIANIFTKEGIPIPVGFSEEDVDLNAPPLFFDMFPLSYLYGMSRMGLLTYSVLLSNVAREDVRFFFTQCLDTTQELYNQATALMLEKGIYDRPPMMPYPDKVEFLKVKETFLSKWMEPQRPLNVIELSEAFFNIERNYFGLILLTAFIQVVKDEELKRYLIKGKHLASKQIQALNEKMIEEDLLGTIMVNTEVTTSTVSPFSERMIMTLMNIINSGGLTYIGHALSTVTRVDLVAFYSGLISEILQYGKEGMDLLIAREWLEEPPHAPNRKELASV